ncbi:hypothetical protein [Candidatus Methylacidithermus pantelleriae]|uniref:Uncharacterized protein n=1 Tax=Candidatus Methylacidithermus pantelleriae TaxID=2744239 RepID=A0A8J2BQU8_9BACT|nr:hypothetical protein [Candidatus Methylacidithermus pantelleriae]CAF0702752.1 hypothetical protein MPNT_50179 [Candidatus Methylacidithermus pantelleriae]
MNILLCIPLFFAVGNTPLYVTYRTLGFPTKSIHRKFPQRSPAKGNTDLLLHDRKRKAAGSSSNFEAAIVRVGKVQIGDLDEDGALH